MRLFELRRDEDEGGVSGTGVVAQGVIFDNGKCAVAWLTKHTSVAVYDSIADVVAIHGHEGKTRVTQFADLRDTEAIRNHCINAIQDDCENVACGLSENGAYLMRERDFFCSLFRVVLR